MDVHGIRGEAMHEHNLLGWPSDRGFSIPHLTEVSRVFGGKCLNELVHAHAAHVRVVLNPRQSRSRGEASISAKVESVTKSC